MATVRPIHADRADVFDGDFSPAEEAEALDAYSTVVTTVAERLLPSVASVRVMRRVPGGGLAEGSGRVVGVATAVAGMGLGLAVPVNDVTRRIVSALMADGRFRRSFLGIGGGPRPLPPRLAAELGRTAGVEVVQVVEASPAARSGLRPEDLILEVDGEAVEDMGDLQRLMSGEVIGRTAEVRIFGGGRVHTLSVTPVELS